MSEKLYLNKGSSKELLKKAALALSKDCLALRSSLMNKPKMLAERLEPADKVALPLGPTL